jgi:hypothetical protein
MSNDAHSPFRTEFSDLIARYERGQAGGSENEQ